MLGHLLLRQESPPQGSEPPGGARLAGLESQTGNCSSSIKGVPARALSGLRSSKALQSVLLVAAIVIVGLTLVHTSRRLPDNSSPVAWEQQVPQQTPASAAPRPQQLQQQEEHAWNETDDAFGIDLASLKGKSRRQLFRSLAQLQIDCPAGSVYVQGKCCPAGRAGPTKCCAENQVYTPKGDAADGCCNAEFACGTTCCVSGECDFKTNQCCAKGGVVKTMYGGCCPPEQMCQSTTSGAYCCPAGTRCFNGICKDVKTFAWLAACSASQVCGPADRSQCCEDDEVCWKNDRCCSKAKQCGAFNCCRKDETCCSSTACCTRDQVCLNAGCHPVGSSVCGRSVCGPDEQCMGGDRCCKRGAQLCGVTCCDLSVSTCLNNQCVPAGSSLCNGLICGPGQICSDGKICCDRGMIGCGGRCCPGDNQCLRNMCVAPGQQMCSTGTVCPSTSTCCGGTCCPSGGVCINGGTCCAPGATSCGGNCCESGNYCSMNNVCCPFGQVCSFWGSTWGNTNWGIWNNIRWRR